MRYAFVLFGPNKLYTLERRPPSAFVRAVGEGLSTLILYRLGGGNRGFEESPQKK
jgi:hypothetical protein